MFAFRNQKILEVEVVVNKRVGVVLRYIIFWAPTLYNLEIICYLF